MNDVVSSEQLRHLVEAASLAPSVHNTQPWSFVQRATALELHADPSRRLTVLDPDGRQLHLSCGAALLLARVAARALGLAVDVRLLPDPAAPTHLADLVVSPGEPATEQEVRLATAILSRHTHRGPFEDRTISSSLLELLQSDADAEGAYLQPVTGDKLLELEVLLSAADAAEEGDEHYRAELAAWVQRDASRGDGVPVDAVPATPGSSLRQRDFTLSHAEQVDGTAPKPDRPTVVVLCTDEDAPEAWLRGGQALAAVLLRAAEHGVQAQPLGQVTDVVAYRFGLRQALGLLGVPQLVLRMGYAGRTPPSPRRAVDEVLVPTA